jgi:hypothetical protein
MFDFLNEMPKNMADFYKEQYVSHVKAKEYDNLQNILKVTVEKSEAEKITHIHISIKDGFHFDFKSALEKAEIKVNEEIEKVFKG